MNFDQSSICIQVMKYSVEVQSTIALLRPGLTGYGSLFFRDEDELLAQVKDSDGFYDTVVLPMKGELEVLYATNWTLWSDLKILACTFISVISGARIMPREVKLHTEPFRLRCKQFPDAIP